VTSSPHSYATFLLRIIETVLAGGKTVSLFNLDYSLAPEAIFPTQLKQAEACYAYLTEEMGIESEKIALMGDSAGGHISLGLLCHLNEPMDGSAPKIETEKPGKGLFLISPWVGLFSQDGYKEKETSDLLSIQGLERWARMIVGGKKPEEVEPYTEFVKRVKGRGSWKDILPDRVWVSAGGDEIFLHNIGGFVNAVKEDGVDAEFEVKEGEAHDWQMAQAVGNEKKYLEGKFGDRDDGLLVGADGIGRAILGEAANNEVSTPTIRRVSTARSGDSSLPPLINLI
jgi:acetyl esterase/lipase